MSIRAQRFDSANRPNLGTLFTQQPAFRTLYLVISHFRKRVSSNLLQHSFINFGLPQLSVSFHQNAFVLKWVSPKKRWLRTHYNKHNFLYKKKVALAVEHISEKNF